MRAIINRTIVAFEDSEIHMPEKLLLTAVLERALRDLELGRRDDVRCAVTWFMEEYTGDSYISFTTVKEHLALSESSLKAIKHKVKEADLKYGPEDKRMQEREEDRVGDSLLVPRAWLQIGQAYPAAQRRGRIVRYSNTFRDADFAYRVKGHSK